jgi:hypothetical protein
MTTKQVLAIKTYCEGAYPNMKKDSTADLVWIDMLKTYQYEGIMKAVKTYILSGNPYSPTIAVLIQNYGIELTSHNEKLVSMVAEELGIGERAEDVTEHRYIDNIRNIVYHPNLEGILKHDDWLPNAIRKCKNQLTNQLYGTNAKLLT